MNTEASTVNSPAPVRPPHKRRARRWWPVVVVAIVGLTGLMVASVLTTNSEEATLVLDDRNVASADGEASDDAPVPDVRYRTEAPANWDVTRVAAGDVLHVRAGPGMHHAVTARLAPDAAELESTGRVARVDGVLWREIHAPGTTTGWVNAHHLTEHRLPDHDAPRDHDRQRQPDDDAGRSLGPPAGSGERDRHRAEAPGPGSRNDRHNVPVRRGPGGRP